jgi:hypothetical protein
MSLCLDHGNKGMISVNMPYGIYNKLKHVDCHNVEMMKIQSTKWEGLSPKNGDIIW